MNKIVENVNNISDELVKLEKLIVSGQVNDGDIHKQLYNLRKKYLRTEIEINRLVLSDNGIGDEEKNVKDIRRRLKVIDRNLKFLDKYYNNVMQVKQKQSIDSLTLITLIFLPLSFITGYFGMNFKAMGSPAMKSGIFSWKKGEHFVFALFLFSIITILVLVKLGVIYG